jgi:hypothetical protein
MMKRYLSVAALALLAVVPLVAQAPKGWMVRADRSTSASDPDAAGAIKFVTMGTGFHATNPQAAVYWNPANTTTGNYTVKGTFTLVKPSGHTNYYGLVFGGSDLEGAKQAYTYFLVAQDGTWLVKRRNGEAATDVLPKAPNNAVKKPGADGKSTNALEVRQRRQDRLRRQRHRGGSSPKRDPRPTYGIRVNHLLEVHMTAVPEEVAWSDDGNGVGAANPSSTSPDAGQNAGGRDDQRSAIAASRSRVATSRDVASSRVRAHRISSMLRRRYRAPPNCSRRSSTNCIPIAKSPRFELLPVSRQPARSARRARLDLHQTTLGVEHSLSRAAPHSQPALTMRQDPRPYAYPSAGTSTRMGPILIGFPPVR